jgi:GntR family transcriptional regulator
LAANEGKRDTIASQLAQEITSGVYGDDCRLPSEGELCKRFNVSRITVRGALERLAVAGLVAPHQGLGWYVRGSHRRRYPLLTIDERGGTTRDVWRTWLASEGLVGGHELTVTVGTVEPHVTEHLQLPRGAECSIRRRVRFIEGEPVMISTGYFPMYLADGTPLAAGTDLARVGRGDAVDLDKPSPLDIITELGHVITVDQDELITRMPDPAEAAALNLSLRGVPVQVDCRISYNAAGIPVRCTHDVMAGHHFRLVIRHERGTP